MPSHDKVDISRERIEKLKSLGCADYIHIALLERIEELGSELEQMTIIKDIHQEKRHEYFEKANEAEEKLLAASSSNGRV